MINNKININLINYYMESKNTEIIYIIARVNEIFDRKPVDIKF